MSLTIGVRVNMFNENLLNESEQDANSVLTELDKGLRSAKIGVQCEAIVRFPRLFEKYPFPILINSSFLKLAEFFLNGSNLLRFWVLRVCQQSENHLDKILNMDAFVKRIFMVIHSNDPVARALTLRTLGAVSRVIPEKQQVHHALRRALDSHDTVEVEAAIYASGQFASQSRSFAISMCAKISDMIESLQIPVAMKLLLIPVLRHMHHDANTSSLVRKLCHNLLPKYPAESFVVAILVSLTELSAQTLTGVPEQVQLLLEFMNDFRRPVRMQALMSLAKLTDRHCVHAWPKTSFNDLIGKACNCSDAMECFLYLKILLKLSNCRLTCHVLITNIMKSTLVNLCRVCLYQYDYNVACGVITILAALATNVKSEHERNQFGVIMELIDEHYRGLLLCTIVETNHSNNFRKILSCGIRIANVKIEFCIELVNTLINLLNDLENYPISNSETICEALGTLCSYFQLKKFTIAINQNNNQDNDADNVQMTQNQPNPIINNILLIIRKMVALVENHYVTRNSRTVGILAAVILQAMIGKFMPTPIMKRFHRVIESTNLWTQYCIARSASRYGQPYLAANIYQRITRKTVSDRLHCYLRGLELMAQAECILNYGATYDYINQNYEIFNNHVMHNDVLKNSIPLMKKLEMGIHLYWQALATLRASTSPINSFTFQLEFLKLRAQFLEVLLSAVKVKIAQIIVPPPAIAGSLAQSSRDYLQKFGHVTNQLRKLVKELRVCEESFVRLYRSAFDADPITLEFLEILQYQCVLFTHIVEKICINTPSDAPYFEIKGMSPETGYLAVCYRRLEDLCKTMPSEMTNNKTINNFHLDLILAGIEIIIKTPLCLPRFFFQVLQSTHIKLSVSPQPRNDCKPVNVQPGSNLVIKVEGVIQHSGKKPSLFRTVDSVQLTLISKLLSPRPINDTTKFIDTVTLTQIVKPQRDFLSGNFLLPVSNGGHWQVTLETCVIDENNITWYTGPKNTMLVRVLDDPLKSQTTTPANQLRRF